MYMEVSEEDNPRLSFDLRFYEANLQLSEIGNFLFRMSQHYAIPDGQFKPLYEEIKAGRFGHLSGGIDRNGRDFMTAYYEQRVDPVTGDSSALCQPCFFT